MRSQQSFMSFVNSKDNPIPRKDCDRLCCAKCRFSTKDTDLFERHVSHHKEMTFSCALCSHVSYSKTESQKHIVSHTGSYPYRCSFCSYGAVRRDYMVKHILRIHKKHAEEGFITDVAFSTPAPVPETFGISGWPKSNNQCANTNSRVEHPHGGQPRVNKSSVIGKTVSQTSSNCARVTCSVTSATAVVPLVVPSYAPSVSHTVGNMPQVVLRSREVNGNQSNSPLNADAHNKLASRRTILERPIPKAVLPRVHAGPAELLQQIPRVAVPEKAIPRVQIGPPAETNSPLRPLLNMPLSKRNVQIDPRASQSTTGNNVSTQKACATALLPSGPIRGPPPPTAEKSNQSRTNSRVLVGSSTETTSPLSSVQVELLAPLNQPIQHNKPLTVSCPEEINIPAGCLVELVEVKNVNGTRELELRLIPPNAIPHDQSTTVDGPSQVSTGGKLSFKCQVAAKECPVNPPTSSASYKVKQQHPSACTDFQSVTKTVHLAHKPQRSTETPSRNKLKPKTKDPGFKRSAAAHEVAACEGPELSSEGLPVISSVFSLCSTPTLTQSIVQSSPETQRSMVATKEPENHVDQSLVCSILIKKEEETEEKLKVISLDLKETKTEHENTEGSTISKACTGETLNTSHLLSESSIIPNQGIDPLNKDNISHQDKKHESGRNEDGHCGTSLLYPKVALVRIPSSLLESVEKLPEVPTQEESLTARPVLCCTLSEQNVSGGPEVAIRLILKRDLRKSEQTHQDHDQPQRKKHKKEKRKAKKRRSLLVEMDLPPSSTERHRELRLIPLKADQLVKLPGPNQPVVVLNHPNPVVQTVSVGVQTLRDYKWVCSTDHEQEQTVSKQPSLKMILKKVHGHKYRVIELKGVSETPLM